jgi:hypothetical protein
MNARDVPPPPRRRITGPPRRAQVAGTRRPADAAGASRDIGAIYLRSLIRAQLRLAVVCCVGFVLSLAGAAMIIATVPALHESYVFGVPWSWALQAYGMYPLILAFAVIYARGAGRNEQRYRSLEERQ